MNRSQLSNRLRQGCCLVLSYVLLLSATIVPTRAQSSGPQPGATDPVGNPNRYNIFPSHDVMSFIPESDGIHLTPYGFDRSLNASPIGYEYPQPYQQESNQMVGAGSRILAPDKDQVVYARRSGSNVAVSFYGPSSLPPSATLPGLADRKSFHTDAGPINDVEIADFMDVAVSDLDKLPDASGNNHDEVVVAYAGPPDGNNVQNINLAVLDYTSDQNDPMSSAPQATTTATLTHTINGNKFADPLDSGASDPTDTSLIMPVDNVLAVATGDMDGDGQNEIMVVHLEDGQTAWLTMFKYTNDGDGNRALTEWTSGPFISPNVDGSDWRHFGSVDVTAGDFNGDGRDELIAARLMGPVFQSNGKWWQGPKMNFAVVGRDAYSNYPTIATYTAEVSNDSNRTQGTAIDFADFAQHTRVQLASGLFTSPPVGDLNRRQFVAGWNPSGEPFGGGASPAVGLEYFSVSDDLQTITPIFRGFTPTNDGTPFSQRFSIAAGNFRGNTDLADPDWNLAVLGWTEGGNVQQNMFGVDFNGGGFNLSTQTFDIDLGHRDPFARYPVVAADLEGKSVRLGAPVHITAENMVNTDFILQEPPKHAFYDNRPSSPTYGQVITVSRYDSFNVALKTSQGTTFSGKSTDHSNWTIGASAQVSAGVTIKESAGVASAKESTDVTAKVGYDYNQNEDSYNSNYAQRTVTQTEQTDHDDKLLGRLQTYDIWRYRVYGVSVADAANNPTNAFYDVVLPGPTVPFDAGGLDKDWYQPVYENGNILSYMSSSFTSGVFSPPDLGAYKIPCPTNPPNGQTCNSDGTLSVTQPMVAVSQTYFGGTSGTTSYDYQNTTGSGDSLTYSHTLAESLDVKTAVSAKVSEGVASESGRVSLDLEAHNNNSWGKTTTSDSTANDGTGLTLSRSSGDSSQSYPFYPAFYTTQDGTIKAAAAITNPADQDGNPAGASFWAGLYGGKADPAVNLPQRFSPVYGDTGVLTGWAPNTGSARKQLRGFFLRKAALNPVTNDYDYLAQAPADGDQVRVEARVYNYSTAQATGTFNVQFQAIPYDAYDDTEQAFTSCPNGQTLTSLGRCVIGETNVSLDPLGMTTAAINWDTTKFGPANTGASSQYRIYAVLDPDNQVNETYETENPKTGYACKDASNSPCSPALPTGLDPGQNNEGYGSVKVTFPTLAATSSAPFDADVNLGDDALTARSSFTGEFRNNNVPAEIYKPLSLRVRLHTDRPHRGISHVLLYDGDPNKGGHMIADKLVHSGDMQGSSVWVNWTPRSLGEHQIFAKVLERENDAKKGNNLASMKVNVVHPDRTPPRLKFNLTPRILWPADGQFVQVRADIETSDDNDSRPQIKLEAITHNQANDASKDVQGAEFGTDDRQFRLRAENTAGREERRVYEVVYTATDWFGNKATAKAEVIVPRKLRQ